MLDFRGLKMK
ncbi:myb transcription factor38 [Zea mays]|uniref:Myb transcription factor38 n=1 Tax=Zea mays TaxID=4577 RepID=A0A1D6KN60_MAIZE|nr:myb transcription factor38 [Zea mays]